MRVRTVLRDGGSRAPVAVALPARCFRGAGLNPLLRETQKKTRDRLKKTKRTAPFAPTDKHNVAGWALAERNFAIIPALFAGSLPSLQPAHECSNMACILFFGVSRRKSARGNQLVHAGQALEHWTGSAGKRVKLKK